MFKLLKMLMVIFVLTTTFSFTQEIHANFDVSYGIFGKIGVAKAVLAKNNKKYSINIKLSATGLAKLLSRNRKEEHTSKGHIENGMMVCDVYKVTKSHGSTAVHKEYKVDHKRKKVIKYYSKYKRGKLVKEKITDLAYYAKNDLLTLYFNLDKVVKDKHKAKTYIFRAVGAEKQKGKVSVIIPKKDALEAYKKILGKDAAWYATAVIHQKIFSSKEGRVMLGVAEDGITNTAVLKDVIFFGDIRAERVK